MVDDEYEPEHGCMPPNKRTEAIITILPENKSEERAIDFWDEEGTEVLGFDDRDDAIEAIIENYDVTPAEIEVCGFVRMKVDVDGVAPTLADRVLEEILLVLDEYYSSTAEDPTEPTEKMKTLAIEFAKSICKEYEPMTCEIACRELVNVREWVKENRPDWYAELEEGD